MERFVAIDGNSLINRAFYATPGNLTDREGNPTGAIFGFVNMLFRLFDDLKPTHLAVAFDLRAPTFRHKMFDGYKATRKGMPEELAAQMEPLKKLLRDMRICILEKEGFEADDILGTVASKSDVETLIVTGDRDALQLIDETTRVCLTKKGISELQILDEQGLLDEFGLTPSQIVDLKALMGDSSDNIPGVRGIGEKTALSLLVSYQTVDGVYEHVDEIKGKLKEKLLSDRDAAFMSKTLATICREVPIDWSKDACILTLPFDETVRSDFETMQFKSLLKREQFFGGVAQKESELLAVKSVAINDLASLKNALSDLKTPVFVDIGENIILADEACEFRIGIRQDFFSEGLDFNEAIDAIRPLLEDEKMEKIVFDSKTLRHSLKPYGVALEGAKFDLMLMQYVADYDPQVTNLSTLFASNGMQGASEGAAVFLCKELKEKLEGLQLFSLYADIELPLAGVLFEMEERGFKVSKEILSELATGFTSEISSLTEQIYELAGTQFNVNSPKQLGEILFEKLMLPYPGKKMRTGYSTNADVLEKLEMAHPIIAPILRYRQLSKLIGTYVEGMGAQIDEKTSLIHTRFKQAATTTGRLSSAEPNLQNIPVRTEEGRLLRKIFIPSAPDRILVSADYSQIELRLLAHFSKEEKLVASFCADEDVHARTASEVFEVRPEEVTADMRRSAKAVNFGIIYGISDFGLASQLGITTRKAKGYIERYFERYPSVRAYMDENVAFCKSTGYVSTITGRRRVIREIRSSNYNVRSFGERAAMNMPLQGSAADIIKIAMLRVTERLKKEELDAYLILQVHDELIVDAKKSDCDAVCRILKEEMEGAVSLLVPLTCNVAKGESWYDAK